MIFQTEKAIKDLGDKVEEKDKKDAEEKIEDLKKALEGKDVDEIKTKTEKLSEVAMSLATKVYEQAAKDREASEANTENETETKSDKKKKNDDVAEADYEEK